jgi:hypothetical protein
VRRRRNRPMAATPFRERHAGRHVAGDVVHAAHDSSSMLSDRVSIPRHAANAYG